MTMSKSEAGRLGALKLKENLLKRYEEQPSTCKYCSSDLPYKKRHNKFCNRSCAASYNNVGVRRHGESASKVCRNCEAEFNTGSSSRIYCSRECNKEYEKKLRVREWLDTGKSPGRRLLREKLLESQQNKCNHCGVPSEWNGKPLVLELEHIDGNSENDCRDNLEMLCPNCHSQTPTYKNRNKGNGRHFRRVRYQEGKSY